MTRRQIREHIFKLLFIMNFTSGEESEEQEGLYFEQIPDEEIETPPSEATQEERAYIKDKTEKVMEKIPEIDARINSVAKGWKTARMAKTDLTLLRLAVYEIRYDDAIPTGVAINEAVELAKKYGSEASPAFVNGILGKLT